MSKKYITIGTSYIDTKEHFHYNKNQGKVIKSSLRIPIRMQTLIPTPTKGKRARENKEIIK